MPERLPSRPASAWISRAAIVGTLCLFVAAALAPTAQSIGLPTGGPDLSPFKYRWKDDTAAGCPAAPTSTSGPCPVNPVTGWTEIAPLSGGSGTMVTFGPVDPPTTTSDQTQYTTTCISLGFTFTYYGGSATCARVHHDGHILTPTTCPPGPPICTPITAPACAGVTSPCGSNRPTAGPMPVSADENGIIAGLWAHMSPHFCNGDYFSGAEGAPTVHVYTKTVGAAGDRTFIVEWSKVMMWHHTPGASVSTCVVGDSCLSAGSPCQRSTFQIRLYEKSGDIDVICKECNVPIGVAGASNAYAFGIEDMTGTPFGLGYDFSAPPGSGLALLNRAVRYYPNHGPACTTPDVTLDEDPASAVSLTMTANDEDLDAISTWTVNGAPSHGALWNPPVGGTLTPPGAAGPWPSATASATRTYMPPPNWNADPSLSTPDTIAYTATDALGAVSTPVCSLKFKVNPVNDAPTFTFNGPASVGASTGALTNLATWANGVAAGPATALDEAGAIASPYPSAQQVFFVLQPHWTPGPITSTNWPDSVFSSLPVLLRMNGAIPSLTVGTTADLSFVGATAGTWHVCFKAVDSGSGTAPNVNTSTNQECIDITLTGGGGGGGGSCGVATAAFDLSSPNPLYGESVSFTDKSTEVGGAINKWSWDFGDGSTSGDKDPVHIYSSPGDYNVRLVVTDSAGCQAFVDKAVHVGYVGSLLGGASSGTGTPVAFAGPDQDVRENEDVQLYGTINGATSAETVFTWKQASGPPVVLEGADTPTPGFTAPLLADRQTPEYLMFSLKVTNGGVSSVADYVQVTVLPLNQPPLADAGADVPSAVPGSKVSLDGSGSSDPDNDALTYGWAQVAGTAISTLPASGKTVTFDVPDGLQAGFADFELTVSDGILDSKDTVRVWFKAPPVPPAFKVTALPDGSFQFESLVACDDCAWDFGDGETAAGKAVVRHAYAEPGDYTVTLQLPSAGTTASRPVSVAIAPDEPAGASAPEAASGLSMLAWIGIAAAVVLVAAGVGLVLWLRRKKA